MKEKEYEIEVTDETGLENNREGKIVLFKREHSKVIHNCADRGICDFETSSDGITTVKCRACGALCSISEFANSMSITHPLNPIQAFYEPILRKIKMCKQKGEELGYRTGDHPCDVCTHGDNDLAISEVTQRCDEIGLEFAPTKEYKKASAILSDKTSMRIVTKVMRNNFLSFTKLQKSTELDKDTLYYKIKKLIKSGILETYTRKEDTSEHTYYIISPFGKKILKIIR